MSMLPEIANYYHPGNFEKIQMPRLHHEDTDGYKASQVTLIHPEGRELRPQTWPDVQHIRSDWGRH